MRDTDNDRLYSFELTEQLLSGSQVEAWKEIAAKTLAEGGDEADMKPLHPLKGTHGTGKCSLIFKDGFYRWPYHIYTTKIDGVVCPPNISETVAGRLMKLAHSQRIASTTIKLISNIFLLSILSILVKTIQRIVAVRVRVKRSEFCSTRAAVARITFRLDRFRKSKPFTQCLLMRYTRVCSIRVCFLHGVNVKCQGIV